MTKKEETILRSIAWPQAMYDAIVRQAKKRKIPAASYIRFAVEQQLRADGEEVRNDIVWGGYRYTEDEDDQGQPAESVKVRA